MPETETGGFLHEDGRKKDEKKAKKKKKHLETEPPESVVKKSESAVKKHVEDMLASKSRTLADAKFCVKLNRVVESVQENGENPEKRHLNNVKRTAERIVTFIDWFLEELQRESGAEKLDDKVAELKKRWPAHHSDAFASLRENVRKAEGVIRGFEGSDISEERKEWVKFLLASIADYRSAESRIKQRSIHTTLPDGTGVDMIILGDETDRRKNAVDIFLYRGNKWVNLADKMPSGTSFVLGDKDGIVSTSRMVLIDRNRMQADQIGRSVLRTVVNANRGLGSQSPDQVRDQKPSPRAEYDSEFEEKLIWSDTLKTAQELHGEGFDILSPYRDFADAVAGVETSLGPKGDDASSKKLYALAETVFARKPAAAASEEMPANIDLTKLEIDPFAPARQKPKKSWFRRLFGF